MNAYTFNKKKKLIIHVFVFNLYLSFLFTFVILLNRAGLRNVIHFLAVSCNPYSCNL